MKKNRHTKTSRDWLLFLCVDARTDPRPEQYAWSDAGSAQGRTCVSTEESPQQGGRLCGLNLTDGQKAQIDQLHQSMKTRRTPWSKTKVNRG